MSQSHLNYLYNYKKIKEELISVKKKEISLLVVTKNQSIDKIIELIKVGHSDFAENRVQEASEKWSEIMQNNKSINLHLIGKLQSNKVNEAFSLFSFIHTLDNEKLANKFSEIQKNSKKKIKFFIQVNIGDENQKNGIKIDLLKDFVNLCKYDLKLDVIGLMCIPPKDLDPEIFFNKMRSLGVENNLKELSMGMSLDYNTAIKCGSTFVRIGSLIFS